MVNMPDNSFSTMEFTKPILLTDSTPQSTAILNGCAHLHAHCILHDHTLATFLPPLSHETMFKWWQDRLSEVQDGTRDIIVQLLPVSSRSATNVPSPTFSDIDTAQSLVPTISLPANTGNQGHVEYEVAGVVMLSKPFSQTGPFRSMAEKLFVSPYHRRKGISRAVMRRLEEVTLSHGRWNVMLDTIVASEAESVYPRLGYRRLGAIPEYGYSPEDGKLVGAVWFWKDLRKDPLC